MKSLLILLILVVALVCESFVEDLQLLKIKVLYFSDPTAFINIAVGNLYIEYYLTRIDLGNMSIDEHVEPLFWNSWNENQYLIPSNVNQCYTFTFLIELKIIAFLGLASL